MGDVTQGGGDGLRTGSFAAKAPRLGLLARGAKGLGTYTPTSTMPTTPHSFSHDRSKDAHNALMLPLLQN